MKNVKRILTALVLSLAVSVNMVLPVSAASTDFGKTLDSYTAVSGEFTLSTSSRFFIVADEEPAGELLETVQLAEREFAAAGKPASATLAIVWGPEEYAKTGDIVIKLDGTLGKEAYQLTVSDKATVQAGSSDGLLYGLNTILKLLRYNNSNTLAGFTAADEPDTKERTVMLDTGRKYYTAEWIKNFIRQISWMGYNTLELHFSEDGGFRADFWDPAYYTENYQPENDFTWLCGSQVQSWVKDPYRNDPDAGKYLTTKELVEILQVAKEYHIDVIPSFDSPAHMDYITWKFEQNYKSNPNYSFTYNGTTYWASSTNGCINYTGKTGASTPSWPYYTTIDITNGTMAKAFVFALYEDIADFFKEYAGSTDFSIGADEVNLSSGYGIKWSYSAFPGYVNELNRMLNAKGYTCRMFNDFIGSTTYNYSSATGKCIYEFDDNIEIMYWNSDFNPNTGTWTEPIWHVWFFWDNETDTKDWGDGGRTLYNCIQTNCYYVLRVAASNTSYPNMDARNPQNYNWTFYHSTEEAIYNEWYPADISEKGNYAEDAADVPEEQLGGAYFLIWNDYAALNTEAEVWNGVEDNTGTSSYVYSLFDRMWSNSIKMWNSDINNTLTYTQFAAIRDQMGYFPGYVYCSQAALLPAAQQPASALCADHSALTAALANKIDGANYTSDSYAAYEKVYNAAMLVNEKNDASEEELANALNALLQAQANLVLRGKTLTVEYKAMVNNAEYTVKPAEVYELSSTGEFEIYVEEITGFPFLRVDGATYVPLASGSGTCGDIVGRIKTDATVTVWFENKPFTTYLEDLLGLAPKEQGNYTEESWAEYKVVLDQASAFCENLPADATQRDVDAIVESFKTAQEGLVVGASSTEIISIQKLAASVRLNGPVSLKVTTTPDVSSLTVDGQTLVSCSGKVQTLNTGDTVKIWTIKFKALVSGTITYTVRANGTVTGTVDVTVK